MLIEILTFANTILIVYILWRIVPLIKQLPKIKHILSMFGSGLVQARFDKVRTKEEKESLESAKKKLATEIKSKVPLGLAEKLDADEIFALITDAEFSNFIKGLGIMGNMALNVVQNLPNPLNRETRTRLP